MKIPHTCSQCLEIEGKIIGEEVPLVDRGIYYFKCDKGHEEVTVLQVPKYEVLFQSGLDAIIDGYFREAVSSFVASLERFYDFYIEAIFTNDGFTEDLKNEFRTKINLSERKIGAFISVYVSENKKMPKVLGSQENKFRNDVIHNGKIPTRDEAIKWAENIQDMILFAAEELSEKYPELLFEVQKKDLLDRYKEVQVEWPKARIATMGFGTALTVFKNPSNKTSVKEILEIFKRRRESSR